MAGAMKVEAANWRTGPQRLRLEGQRCSFCGSLSLTQRIICPVCRDGEVLTGQEIVDDPRVQILAKMVPRRS